MLPPLQAHPGLLASKKRKTFDYVDGVLNANNLTTYSIAVQLGAPAPDRMIAIGICGVGGSSRTLNSASIGGVAASIAIQQTSGGNSVNPFIAVIYAIVPTGASGNVSLTFSAAMGSCQLAVYRATGLKSAVHFDGKTGPTTGNPKTATLNVPDKGFVIGSVVSVSSGAAPTWPGAAQSRYGNNSDSAQHWAGDSYGLVPAQTGYLFSCGGLNSGNSHVCAASFG